LYSTSKDADSSSATNSPFNLWGATFASEENVDGSAATGSARRRVGVVGGLAGVSMALGPQTLVGFGAGDSDTNVSLADGVGRLSANIFHAGVYGASRLGDVSFGAAIGYSLMGVESNRSILGLGSSSLRGKYEVPVWAGRFRLAYEGIALRGVTLTPYSLIQVSQASIPSFSESDASSGAVSGISSTSRTASTKQTELGIKVTRSGKVAGLGLTGILQTGWVHYLKEDADMDASFAALPSAQFSVKGARNDKDLARISVGFEIQVTPRVTLGSQVELSTSRNVSGLSGKAGVQYAF
jgi:outer membrane autotransporter protein